MGDFGQDLQTEARVLAKIPSVPNRQTAAQLVTQRPGLVGIGVMCSTLILTMGPIKDRVKRQNALALKAAEKYAEASRQRADELQERLNAVEQMMKSDLQPRWKCALGVDLPELKRSGPFSTLGNGQVQPVDLRMF